MLYGEIQVAHAELVAVPNPAPERDYRIDLAYPEFTCLCPVSGFPDFATIRISYIPHEQVIELKALKLYLNRYRDEHLFHEAVANRILTDLVNKCDPNWMRVIGDFNVRGNLKTVVTAVHVRPGFSLADSVVRETSADLLTGPVLP